MSLSHAYFQDQLVSNQRLTPAEQAALEEHLAACPECRAYAAFHHALLETLPYPAKTPRHSEREIREKIAAANARVQRRRWPETLFHNTLSLASMTAALLLLVVAFHFIPRMIPGHQSHLHPAAMQGPTVAQPPASARPTPSPTATPTLSLSSVFPLDPGATWAYSVVDYSQAANDPEKILQETSRIEERLVETQSIPPYTVLHIQANRSILSTDPGWDENRTVGPYEYWYVIKDNQVFLTYDNPAITPIDLNKILLAYQFPMTAGSEWCHNPIRKGTVEDPTPDPNSPCLYRRVVKSVGPYQSPIGELKSCYEIHDVAASGDVISQFCDGIGLVAETYNHSGTPFGSQQELIQFTDGKDGPRLVVRTPPATGTPTGTGESLASPDAQSLVPAVAALGQMAYTGIGSRLAAIDISQPAAPRLVAQSEDLPGEVMKVLTLPDSAAGSRVVVSAGRYLAVLDASTPGALGLITQSKLPGPINALIYDISASTLYAGGTLLSNPALGYITRLDASAPDVLQLQETAQLAAPVQSLALGKFTLYAALRGQSPGVTALPLEGSRIGAPREVIPGVTVASMTAVGDLLYLGAQGQMLAYTITQPTRPEAAWQITQSGGAAIPGTLFGFEVRPDVIYAAGLDATGRSFRLALTPPVQIVTGSMVDTASCVAAADGKMLVAGDPLAIYDSLNLDTLPLLGAFTPANP